MPSLFSFESWTIYGMFEPFSFLSPYKLMVFPLLSFSVCDSEEDLMKSILEFICDLVNKGDHALAQVLHLKVVEKAEARKNMPALSSDRVILAALPITTKIYTIQDFKSSEIAEQMTLLDSELFLKIEVHINFTLLLLIYD